MREYRALATLTVLALFGVGFIACSQNVEETPATGESPPATEASAAARPAAAASHEAAGVRWTAPANWKIQPARAMRVATYSVPAAEGDAEDGECAVFFFGAGQGGDVESNIRRWIGQFQQPDGKPSEEAAERGEKTIAGLKVTTLKLDGTYLASAGPMAPAQGKKPGYRLLGAIVEAPAGAVFFKFTGPAKTLAAAEADFNGMIGSLQQN
jgi:hypothetical protein